MKYLLLSMLLFTLNIASASESCNDLTSCLQLQKQTNDRILALQMNAKKGTFLRKEDGKLLRGLSQTEAIAACKAISERLPTIKELAYIAAKEYPGKYNVQESSGLTNKPKANEYDYTVDYLLPNGVADSFDFLRGGVMGNGISEGIFKDPEASMQPDRFGFIHNSLFLISSSTSIGFYNTRSGEIIKVPLVLEIGGPIQSNQSNKLWEKAAVLCVK